MKVLVFTYSISRVAGGVFSAVRDLFTNERFKSIKLKIFAFKDRNSQEDMPSWQGLPIQLFKPRWFLFSRRAKINVLREDADILHMEGLWRYPQLFMSAWKQKTNKPVICSPHGMLDPYIISSQGKFKRMIARLFFQKSLDSVTCYHALCEKEMKDIRAYGAQQPIAIIPNGINIPVRHINSKKEDGKKHLLYLGRLHQKKGIDLLVKALADIKHQTPELLDKWEVDIVGWDDEGFQDKLEKLVHQNQLENIITFHGSLFGEKKERMYASSDAFILPSHGEGLPMTVLEAWSWKLPVIMTPKCNIPEGFQADAALYIEDNRQSVVEGLVRLFHMTEAEREEMGERGYQLVEKDFTWDASAEKMIALYQWILGKMEKPDFVYE